MPGFVECAQNFPDGIIGAAAGTHVLSHLFFHLRSRRKEADIDGFIRGIDRRRGGKCAAQFFKIGLVGHFVVRAMERAVRIVRVGHQEKRLTGRVCPLNEGFTQLPVVGGVAAASQFILVEAFVPLVARLRLKMIGLAEAGIEIALLFQYCRQHGRVV